jgi:protocatechuate 3,4-dioxygenase beta subunit
MKKLLVFALIVATVLARAETNSSRTFQVKVSDIDGQPIPGAIVERYVSRDWTTGADLDTQAAERRTTDRDGAATFTATDQASILVARKRGLSLSWGMRSPSLAGSGPEENTLELTLTAPAAVSGTVQDAAGNPVPHAPVWVKCAFLLNSRDSGVQSWTPLSSHLGRQYLAARTSADGKFQIEGLPAEATLDLAVTRQGLALDQPPRTSMGGPSLSFSAGASNIVLTLKPAGSIEGRVVQEETGAPLPGARIMLHDTPWLWGGREPFPPTGPDGIFRLPDLSAGGHTIRAVVGTNQFPDWVCDTANVSVEAGATNRDVKITASRGAVLEVTVHEEAGDRPIQGATVMTPSQSQTYSAFTSDKGIARLRLSPGDYHLFISKEGFNGHRTQVTLERGQTNRLTVALQPSTKVTGTVTDAEGKPAAKALISLFLFARGNKKTDAQGRFTLNLDSNQFGGMSEQQHVILARDLTRNLAATLDLEEGTTNVTLRLEPALTLAGRVTDASGKPVANAEVQVMFRTERMSSSFGSPVRVDAEGRFEIKGLPLKRSYALNVSARGFGRGSRDIEAQETAKRRVELEPFKLPVANQRVAGVVVGADDKPVAGANVYSYGEDQPNLNARTDAKGRFALDQVCAGPIQISANDQHGGHGSVNAEGGQTNITIQLGVSQPFARSGGSLKLAGTVVGPDGKPAPKVAVCLFPFHDSEKQTDAEGCFKLTADPNYWGGSRDWPHVAIARDFARNLATALDVESDATNADLRLEPGITILGRVTDASGKAITNAEAHLMFHTERFGSSLGAPVRVNAEGRFEIKALPPGRRYSVNASAKGFGQESRRVEPSEGETRVELEPFQLPVADQRIAGVVLDDNDKPVARAWINSYGDKQPNLNAQTDAQGRFSFDKVCAGSIQLSANSQRGGYANITAEGGDTNIVIRISASPTQRVSAPRTATLKGKPLPDLAPLGLTPADCPADQPILAVVIDAEQRPSRRALRLLGDQAAALKQKGVAVVVIQVGPLTGDAFAAWKKEAALPFPVGRPETKPEQARAAWGAAALPWLILTDKTHRVAAEGFAPEELDARIEALPK